MCLPKDNRRFLGHKDCFSIITLKGDVHGILSHHSTLCSFCPSVCQVDIHHSDDDPMCFHWLSWLHKNTSYGSNTACLAWGGGWQGEEQVRWHRFAIQPSFVSLLKLLHVLQLLFTGSICLIPQRHLSIVLITIRPQASTLMSDT